MLNVVRLSAIVLILAGLDVAGAIALKEAQVRSSPGLALLGVATFVSVAGVLYVALDEAELTVVSLAWIILYQVTVMGIDTFYYGNVPSRLGLAATAVALIALGVAAVAGPAQKPEPTPPGRHVNVPFRQDSHRPPLAVPRPRPQVDLESVPPNLRLKGLPRMRSSPETPGSTPETPATPRPAPHE